MGGGSVKDMKSTAELDAVIKSGVPVILHFWTSWCEASKHMDEVFSHLSTDFPTAHFLRVEAEEQPEISETYAVSAVPFFAFIKDGKTADALLILPVWQTKWLKLLVLLTHENLQLLPALVWLLDRQFFINLVKKK